jgi:lipoprotein Spr
MNFNNRMIARVLYLFLTVILFGSCSLFKPVARTESNKSASPFMDNIVVSLNAKQRYEKANEKVNVNNEISDRPANNYLTGLQGIEFASPLSFHYALLLDVEVEKIKNQKLFEYITQWWAVPYRIGGNGMNGIDCSAFVKGITTEAFSINLPRTSREQADYSTTILKEELIEGDLVFFNTGGGISHVGMYLNNNKFVHASTSMGVVISDLNETYWNKRFVKAGRIHTN